MPKEEATILKNVISIPSNSDVYRAYFQSKEFTVLSDAYAMCWKDDDVELSQNQYLFMVLCINKVTDLPIYSYKNKLGGWNVVKNKYIQLPQKDGCIDFEFMESFIADLKAKRIAELTAYLTISGLTNYKLSKEEKELLKNLNSIEFVEKNITDIFEIRNTKNILSRDIVEDSGETPYLCASAENNAVSTYISYEEAFLDKGNCIFIGGKTFVVTYQEKDFYSNDSHNLALYLKDHERNKNNQLFLAACVYRGLGYKYSWGDSISGKKILEDKIMLPTSNGEIDFEIMERIIKTVKKLVIKELVLYADNKNNATKSVVDKNK